MSKSRVRMAPTMTAIRDSWDTWSAIEDWNALQTSAVMNQRDGEVTSHRQVNDVGIRPVVVGQPQLVAVAVVCVGSIDPQRRDVAVVALVLAHALGHEPAVSGASSEDDVVSGAKFPQMPRLLWQRVGTEEHLQRSIFTILHVHLTLGGVSHNLWGTTHFHLDWF